MRDVSESWQPEIGQQVRVRIRPTCDYCTEAATGLTGIVVCTQHTEDMLDEFGDRDFLRHHYWVRLDTTDRESHYMAAELDSTSAISGQGLPDPDRRVRPLS